MAQFTILTGDIVDSSDLPAPALTAAFEALGAAAERISGWQGAPTRFTRNRGDGWQVCLSPARPGLREALTMRAALRSLDKTLDTRIAIARGAATLPRDGDLNAATGPAFLQAGHLLDRLEDGTRDSPLMAHADGQATGAAVVLADALSRGWTPAQARAVLPMLAPDAPTHDEVARQLGITRQGVRQALVAAGFPALSRALDLLEQPDPPEVAP